MTAPRGGEESFSDLLERGRPFEALVRLWAARDAPQKTLARVLHPWSPWRLLVHGLRSGLRTGEGRALIRTWINRDLPAGLFCDADDAGVAAYETQRRWHVRRLIETAARLSGTVGDGGPSDTARESSAAGSDLAAVMPPRGDFEALLAASDPIQAGDGNTLTVHGALVTPEEKGVFVSLRLQAYGGAAHFAPALDDRDLLLRDEAFLSAERSAVLAAGLDRRVRYRVEAMSGDPLPLARVHGGSLGLAMAAGLRILMSCPAEKARRI
jgi:hypothetical protein